MIPFQLRLILVAGALLAVWIVARQIRKNKMLVEDAIFWMVTAFVLVVLAVFPGIATSLAQLLGFMSPANFVYLVVIALLLWKAFTNSAEISRLKAKVTELAQEIALAHMDEKDGRTDRESR
ncbi:DUF2304 domain-containing protein [Olsenella sp. An285]|uniref:DUF2304 domain-containing protein n=1 Tax=Olsenella sp. An285 TaxID=1965621 RepID=UPI001F14EF0C|nr:DUF2304 domain-containing protein [Olsenella sp. An285]